MCANNISQFYDEISEYLEKEQQGLKLEILPVTYAITLDYKLRKESVVIKGNYNLLVPDSDQIYQYDILVNLPDDYPNHMPELFCVDSKLPADIDRHIYPTKKACLGINADNYRVWRQNPTISIFFDFFVYNFLVWQFGYDLYKVPPKWGARAHGLPGLREAYKEILNLEDDSDPFLFYGLLTRKNEPQGHERCPCGSGKKTRDCHGQNIKDARRITIPSAVKDDLEGIVGRDKNACR